MHINNTITDLTRLLRIWRPLRVFGRADCLFLPPLLLLWPDPAPRPSHCCRTGKGRGRGWWGWGRRAGQTGTLAAPLFILPSGLTSCALKAAVIIRAHLISQYHIIQVLVVQAWFIYFLENGFWQIPLTNQNLLVMIDFMVLIIYCIGMVLHCCTDSLDKNGKCSEYRYKVPVSTLDRHLPTKYQNDNHNTTCSPGHVPSCEMTYLPCPHYPPWAPSDSPPHFRSHQPHVHYGSVENT